MPSYAWCDLQAARAVEKAAHNLYLAVTEAHRRGRSTPEAVAIAEHKWQAAQAKAAAALIAYLNEPELFP